MHIGIIPDGHRRWSKKNGIPADSVLPGLANMIVSLGCRSRNVGDAVAEVFDEVTELSLFFLSVDNVLKRNDGTMQMIQGLLEHIEREIDGDRCHARFRFVGELELLPVVMRMTCEAIELKSAREGTSSTQRIPVTVGIAYDPVKDARRVLDGDPARAPQSPIDLVIRSGGETRSSGFFPLHTLYSEWVYVDELFPDMTPALFRDAIDEFRSRTRRFGG